MIRPRDSANVRLQRIYSRNCQRRKRRNTILFNWLLRTTTRSGNPRRGEVDSLTGRVRWYASGRPGRQ
jgi:hypothetical protein